MQGIEIQDGLFICANCQALLRLERDSEFSAVLSCWNCRHSFLLTYEDYVRHQVVVQVHRRMVEAHG